MAFNNNGQKRQYGNKGNGSDGQGGQGSQSYKKGSGRAPDLALYPVLEEGGFDFDNRKAFMWFNKSEDGKLKINAKLEGSSETLRGVLYHKDLVAAMLPILDD